MFLREHLYAHFGGRDQCRKAPEWEVLEVRLAYEADLEAQPIIKARERKAQEDMMKQYGLK